MNLSSKRIMLTGGAGFLGSFVAEKLKARGCTQIFIPKEQDYDLTKATAIEAAFNDAGRIFSAVPNPISISLRTPRPPRLSGELPSPASRPPVDIVIHLAAKVGGIGAYPKFAPI